MGLLINRIKDDMKAAMRAKEKETLKVIRTILAAFKQIEIDEAITLDEERMVVILDKMLKQRRESIKQFKEAGRLDLSDIEEAEITVIQKYLPVALTESEINDLVEKAVVETGAGSIKDMGKVMGVLKPQMLGRADMSVVGKLIKSRLAV